jgi:hypothetical protein
LSRELSPRWSLRVSDYYSRTNDLYTFYALRGAEIQEEGLVLYFYPVTTNTSIGTNSLSVSVDHTLSPRSELSFTASHSIGLYGTGQAAAPLVGLSDLQTISATASYTRRLNDRTSLSVGYNGSYFGFDSFDGAVSTAVTVGLSTVVAKDTTFDISAGPSRVSNVSVEGSNNTNLAASVSLSKRIEKNSFSFSLSNNNATASGVGSVSNTRSAIASVSRPLSRRVSIYGNFSAYDGTGIVGNPFRTRGISATANVGYSLARNLSLHGGFQYQRYIHPVQYAYTQKGVFVSLRYSHPNLLRSR